MRLIPYIECNVKVGADGVPWLEQCKTVLKLVQGNAWVPRCFMHTSRSQGHELITELRGVRPDCEFIPMPKATGYGNLKTDSDIMSLRDDMLSMGGGGEVAGIEFETWMGMYYDSGQVTIAEIIHALEIICEIFIEVWVLHPSVLWDSRRNGLLVEMLKLPKMRWIFGGRSRPYMDAEDTYLARRMLELMRMSRGIHPHIDTRDNELPLVYYASVEAPLLPRTGDRERWNWLPSEFMAATWDTCCVWLGGCGSARLRAVKRLNKRMSHE